MDPVTEVTFLFYSGWLSCAKNNHWLSSSQIPRTQNRGWRKYRSRWRDMQKSCREKPNNELCWNGSSQNDWRVPNRQKLILRSNFINLFMDWPIGLHSRFHKQQKIRSNDSCGSHSTSSTNCRNYWTAIQAWQIEKVHFYSKGLFGFWTVCRRKINKVLLRVPLLQQILEKMGRIQPKWTRPYWEKSGCE